MAQPGASASRESMDATADYPTYLDAPGTGAKDIEKAQYSASRWIQQREYYSGMYRQWSKTILFLLMKQWLSWNKTQQRWTAERNVPKWRQQPVTNLVFSVYRSAIAKLTKQRPAFQCVPASGDTDDRNAAALGDSLLKYWWRSFKLPTILKRAIGWLLTTGNAYILVSWDPEAGEVRPIYTTADRVVGVDEVGEPIVEMVENVPADKKGDPKLDADGNPDLDAEPHKIAIGEIDISLVSSMSVRFNPDAESPETATEWFIGEVMPTHRAAAMLKMDAAKLGGSADDELVSTIDMITAATTGTSGALNLLNGTDNSTAQGKRSLVLRYYRKKCDEYPKGRHWITVDGRMWPKGEQELPYGFWPPAVPIQDVPVPGQPLAMGLLSQIVPLNEKYNTLDGIVMEHNVTMAKGGKWLTSPEDQNLAITSDPAQKLVSKGYAVGKPPMQLQPKPLPDAVLRERDRALQELQIVAAVSEVSFGQKPEGVSSGRGFLVLQEATDSVLNPLLVAIEGGLEEIGRRCLVLAHRFYREERTVKIGGENGVWQFRAFQGSDLSDSLDVQVQVGSSFPWSKAARQDTVLSLVQSLPALVMNPDGSVNTQKLARYLNIGGIEAFETENDPDSDEIEMEHAEFENPKGAVPQIGFWQDHAAHYAGHANFLKRDRERFNRWPKDRQQAFLQHVMQTQAAIAEALQGMMPEAGQPSAESAPAEAAQQGEATGISTGAPPESEIALNQQDMNAIPRAA